MKFHKILIIFYFKAEKTAFVITVINVAIHSRSVKNIIAGYVFCILLSENSSTLGITSTAPIKRQAKNNFIFNTIAINKRTVMNTTIIFIFFVFRFSSYLIFYKKINIKKWGLLYNLRTYLTQNIA